MKRKRVYRESKCLKVLIEKGRIPLLFIGSGISKRYLVDYPSWDDLISYIAETINISTSQLLALKQEITDANPSESIGVINSKLGSMLTKIFREKIIKGEIDLEKIFTIDEIEYITKNNITFSKMLISKKMSSYEFTTVAKYTNEIAEFKKLQANIGAVVTTNYDKFLETDIFNNFDVFVEQSQYYMTESTGVGEIYKIHGSVSSPNSIIFTSEDYKNFDDNLKVIAAKLLNLSLEYPIIFLGYSLEDENILKILYTLVDSLTEEQINVLSKNLIYVEWKPNEENLVENEKTINKNGKSLKMTCISTDNYFVLYKFLQKFIPAEKPERVRKYKKMIQQLVINNNKGIPSIIANDNLDKLNNEGKLVVAFGDRSTLAQKGIVGIKTEDLIKWVLEQKNDIDENIANSVFKDFYLTTKVASGHYVPMFYISKFTRSFKNEEKLLEMKSNLIGWAKKINDDDSIPLSNNLEELYKQSTIPEYKFIRCMTKAYINNKITYDDCITVLNDLNNNDPLLKLTDFRKAVSYLDLK